MKRLSPEEQKEARREAAAKAASRPASTRKSSLAAARIKKEKAVEATFRRYFKLECGHYGQRDAMFNPRNGKYFCEKEYIFSPALPPATRRDYPEEPEF